MTPHSDRVRGLLSGMTREEKLAQLRIVYRPALADAIELARGGIGAVFWPQSAAATNALQRAAVTQTRLGIPLLVGLDVIHGQRTIYPTPLGLAASFDPELARRCAALAAREARSGGVNWTFAPMVDVSYDPRWGRVVEGFGEDVLLTSVLGRATIEGFQGDDLARDDAIAATAKHFVAYGASEGGRDYNTAEVSTHRLRNVYLEPFRHAVDAGAAAVMASFNTVGGVPVHIHRPLLTGVLKEEWGFDGIVVGDADGVPNLLAHRVAGDLAVALQLAHEAGLDVEMGGSGSTVDPQDLARIDPARVDDAVGRILSLKERLGLFDAPYVEEPVEIVGPTAQARSLVREAAGHAAVLLENDGTLPLRQDARLLLAGPYATSSDLLGAWTQSFAAPAGSVADEMVDRCGPDRVAVLPGTGFFDIDEPGIEEAAEAAKSVDVAVVFVGEPSTISGEAASRSDIRLPGAQERLITRIAATGTPTVVVIVTGRPLDVTAWIDDVAAAVVVWHGGTEAAAAIVDVLLGTVDPAGRLPMSFPRSVGQIPIHYAHENTGRPPRVRGFLDEETIDVGVHGPDNLSDKFTSKYLDDELGPRYAFGHGGGYGRFVYDSPTVSSATLTLDQLINGMTFDVSIGLENIGDRTADDVIMVFVEDPVSRQAPPVRRVVAFERMTLEPGERREASFSLGQDALATWFTDVEPPRREIEPGELVVHIGPRLDRTQSLSVVIDA